MRIIGCVLVANQRHMQEIYVGKLVKDKYEEENNSYTGISHSYGLNVFQRRGRVKASVNSVLSSVILSGISVWISMNLDRNKPVSFSLE